MRNRLILLMICCGAGVSSPASAQSIDSITSQSAYLDAPAREHVRLARARRQIADLSVQGYKVLSKERISVGLRGIRRDRLLYRREVAGRIDWTRGGQGRIEILGARDAVPVAIKGVQVPSDLDSYMPHLAFDPADTRLLLGWNDNDFVRHPLADGSERYYQFRTGGTTSIQLPGGKVVRIVEIEIIPRTADAHNVSGSFWLEADTHSVVQAAFRLARDVDFFRDLPDEDESDKEDEKEIPKMLKPITFSVDYVTLEYSLYDLQWWMPRSVLFEGTMRAGFLKAPMQYTRTYSNYEIRAGAPATKPLAELIRTDSVEKVKQDSCARTSVSVRVRIGEKAPAAGAAGTDSTVTRCGRWVITMPADSTKLLSSAELPADMFAAGEELVSEGELRELEKRIKDLDTGGPQMLPHAITDHSLLSPGLMRYNRVEGLSVGADGSVDYGALRLSAQARIGVADLVPNAELSVERPGRNNTLKLTAYRRLNAFDPNARPFSMGASLSALLFGDDEADYYRSAGAELRIEPSGAHARWYALRLYGQHETAAENGTDFSARHLLNGSYVFRPNLVATRENEFGSELTLRFNHGLNPNGLRFSGDVYAHGAAGTNEFGRGAVTLRAGFPLSGAFAGALEGGVGLTSAGAPIQHRWYVGGATTLRGYNASTLSGEAFWRGRAEVGYGLPAVRLVGFSDIGWAGARDGWSESKPLVSVGAGASFLDGIVRFDVARGLKAPKGWGVTLYLDAAL